MFAVSSFPFGGATQIVEPPAEAVVGRIRSNPSPSAVHVGHLNFPFRNYLLDGITMALDGNHSPQGVLRSGTEIALRGGTDGLKGSTRRRRRESVASDRSMTLYYSCKALKSI